MCRSFNTLIHIFRAYSQQRTSSHVREQIDRSKHGSDMELKLCGVEYGHLSACRLMDITDLSLWRIKLHAFRMGYGSHCGCYNGTDSENGRVERVERIKRWRIKHLL